MAERLKRGVASWPLFWVASLWLSFQGVVHLWPSEWFMEVDSVFIFDTVEGEPVTMTVDRTIHRPFTGVWSVVVRKHLPEAGWEQVCDNSRQQPYSPDAALPHSLTLRWWTADACGPLEAGVYYVSSSWQIVGNGILPEKYVYTRSNVFRVTTQEVDGLARPGIQPYDLPPPGR